MMCGAGAGSGVQVVDSPLLTQQIEAQRLCIKHLKNENNRLKVQIHRPFHCNPEVSRMLNCADAVDPLSAKSKHEHNLCLCHSDVKQ